MTEFEVMIERIAQAREPGRTSAFRRRVLGEAEEYLCTMRDLIRQALVSRGTPPAGVVCGDAWVRRAAELTNPQLNPD